MYRNYLGGILLVTLLAGCGTASPTLIDGDKDALHPRRVESRGSNYLFDLPAEGGVHAVEIRGTPQSVYSHVAEAYQELGIPVEVLDTNNFLIGNAAYKVRRQVGKIPMSRIVDCGFTVSGARADRDMITFDLRTQVKPAGAGNVNVETLLIAVARSTEGASSNPVNCTSRGELERQIADSVRRRAGA
jgi:hypothetical protein